MSFHVRFGAGSGGVGSAIGRLDGVPKFGHRNEFDRLAIKRALAATPDWAGGDAG